MEDTGVKPQLSSILDRLIKMQKQLKILHLVWIFYLPANDYQKAMRSAKYALLVISLTFLTFFLVEIFNQKKMHPFQYILVGLSLCLFYTLLLSISEHTNFNLAYLISSIALISMIGFMRRLFLRI
jgi:inner membrane protein